MKLRWGLVFVLLGSVWGWLAPDTGYACPPAFQDTVNNACRTNVVVGGATGSSTTQITVTSGVTTNTTSSAVSVPSGGKSFYGQVVCSSGACTQTQAIYGDIDSDVTNGILLCTLTLSGTTRAQDACPVITANFTKFYVVTTATTGTAATGAVYAMY